MYSIDNAITIWRDVLETLWLVLHHDVRLTLSPSGRQVAGRMDQYQASL